MPTPRLLLPLVLFASTAAVLLFFFLPTLTQPRLRTDCKPLSTRFDGWWYPASGLLPCAANTNCTFPIRRIQQPVTTRYAVTSGADLGYGVYGAAARAASTGYTFAEEVTSRGTDEDEVGIHMSWTVPGPSKHRMHVKRQFLVLDMACGEEGEERSVAWVPCVEESCLELALWSEEEECLEGEKCGREGPTGHAADELLVEGTEL